MKPASLKAVKYRVRRSRVGLSMVDRGPTVAVLRYARQAGMTWREIGRACDLDWQHIERIGNERRPQLIYRSTRDTILKGLAGLVDERMAALEDAASAIQFALRVEPPDDRRWPAAPVLGAMDARWPVEQRLSGECVPPPLTAADRRYLYRSETLDTERAERVCRDLDLLPESIWPGWFELEETG